MRPLQFSIRTILLSTCVVAGLLSVAIWYFDIPHAAVEKVPSLHGKSDIFVFEKLGQPDHEYAFTMDGSLGEFQIELYNTYPPNSPKNSLVKIRECTWEYSWHRVTVWFHKPTAQWIALDTCRYRKGVKF